MTEDIVGRNIGKLVQSDKLMSEWDLYSLAEENFANHFRIDMGRNFILEKILGKSFKYNCLTKDDINKRIVSMGIPVSPDGSTANELIENGTRDYRFEKFVNAKGDERYRMFYYEPPDY